MTVASRPRGGSLPRNEAVPKYFVKTPDEPTGGAWAGPVLIFGVIATLIGGLIMCREANGFALAGIGILMVFVSWGPFSSRNNAMSLYRQTLEKSEPKPSDNQMDSWLNEDISRIRGDALRKLDLETEQLMRSDPLLIVGPADRTAVAAGKDGIVRFSKYDIVVIYLTDYHLAAYTATLDMASGDVIKESTQEYHYTDVVSVATQTGNLFNIIIDGETKSIDIYQKFSLAVASGDHIDVVVAFPQEEQIKEYLETGQLRPSGADEAIRVIRARLREKKGGTHA